MGVVYIAFILSTGYIFTTLHLPSSYKLSKYEGWLVYSQVALYGFLFFIITLPILMYIDAKDHARFISSLLGLRYYHYKEFGITTTDAKIIAWAISSFSLSFVFGCLSWVIYKIPYLRSRVIAKSVRDDVLDSVIYDNSLANLNTYEGESFSYISVTLKSRKVYVGICNNTTIRQGSVTAIELTPVLSGYRDESTLEVHYKTNYFDHYNNHHSKEESVDYKSVFEKFKATVTVSEVESISLFDIDEFNRFKEKSSSYNLNHC